MSLEKLTNLQAEATAIVELYASADPVAILAHLSPDDFTDKRHASVYAKMSKIVYGGGKLRGDVEVMAMLAEIQPNAKTTLRGMALVDSVKRLTQRRKLYLASVQAVNESLDFSIPADEALARASRAMDQARDDRIESTRITTIKQAAEQVHDRFALAHDTQGKQTPVMPFGFDALSGLIDVQRGDFVVLGARTSTGKTAFTLNQGINLSLKGHRVCYLCREMTSISLAERVLARMTGEDSRNLRKGVLSVTPDEYGTGLNAVRAIGDSFVMAHPRTLADALMIANICRDKYGCEYFFFDYLQQFHVPRSGPREQVIAVTDAVKAFAIDNQAICVGPAQLNRQMEQGRSHAYARPRLSHLKESGTLEQDADIVLLLWNPVNEDKEVEARDDVAKIGIDCDLRKRRIMLDTRNQYNDTQCALYFDKYRGGERFRCVAGFNGPRTEFYF